VIFFILFKIFMQTISIIKRFYVIFLLISDKPINNFQHKIELVRERDQVSDPLNNFNKDIKNIKKNRIDFHKLPLYFYENQ
jgi:hypothetical protein